MIIINLQFLLHCIKECFLKVLKYIFIIKEIILKKNERRKFDKSV